MKRILFPTDFSNDALNAYSYALHLADLLDTEIHLLHAYINPGGDPYMPMDMLYEMIEKQKESALKHFEEYENQLSPTLSGKGISSVEITHHIIAGLPVSAILDSAKQLKPDLILMGTKGASGLDKILFGSNTANVIAKSDFPVLAIPAEAKYKRVKNIAYATSFEEEDEEVISELAKIAALFKARIHFVHVSLDDRLKPHTALKNKAKGQWGILGEFKTTLDVVHGKNIIDKLEEYAFDNEIDLLVMLNHRRNLVQRILDPSVSRKMALKNTLPLWIFKCAKE